MSNFRKHIAQAVFAVGIVLFVVIVVAIQFDIRGRAEDIPIKTEEIPSLPIPVLKDDGKIYQMDLEDYVGNVILGEVPADFHSEALKAQAVASRTYTLQIIASANKHPLGAVCTDHRCCQAYREPDEYLLQYGTEAGLQKIRAAVEETRREVLYFHNELICATYFASSGGITEDAEAVWGESYPYLQSVFSPGEEECGYYENQVAMSSQELQDRLGVRLEGNPKDWFGMITYTVGDGVELMRIGGKLYTGVELREILGLRSTIIEVSIYGEKIMFTTKGYGHRVGMSQHGANAMAMDGRDYQSILHHYYRGVALEQYRNNND